ncbi:MAG TPA: hypothetical protein VG817_02770, partial [Gemmatimonadales bacterium]|nr:hypothetical protein [Gemmatimonadales bacterium]
SDNGPGIGSQKPGIGLSNTSERLSTLYGERGRLTLSVPAGGGTRAEVRLPYHEHPVNGVANG